MIDAKKNITLDRAEDTFLPMTWSGVDISTANIALIVKDGFTVVPTLGTSGERIFHFTPAQAQGLGDTTHYYMVRMITGGTSKVLWRGQISSKGFTA